MSSSSSTPQSIARAMQTEPTVVHRQVDYYDGRNVCIAESRRRQHVTRTGTPTLSPACLVPQASKDQQAPSRMNTSSSPASWSNTSSSTKVPRSEPHVTRKSRRTKIKTVIVQASVADEKLDRAWARSKNNIDDIMTPPQTPKMGRLPTPDLDDVGGRRFCNCCSEGKVVQFCTWYGQCLDSMKR